MIIGERIKKLRKSKNITQEQLGNALGVTMQAVSKWEHGCTPDTSMLPLLADYFSVSIDELFGRNSEIEQDIVHEVERQLNQIDDIEEKKAVALQIGQAVGYGFLKSESDRKLTHEFKIPYPKDGDTISYRFQSQDFVERMIITDDKPYCFFMPEPDGGFYELVGETEKYRELFHVFADKTVLQIYLFIFQQKADGFTIDALGQGLNMGEETVKEAIKKLKDRHLVYAAPFQSENGLQMAYTIAEPSNVVPLLCALNEMLEKENSSEICGKRTKPVLNRMKDSGELK